MTLLARPLARAVLVSLVAVLPSAGAAANPPSAAVDHRFAPPDWQTAICLPDDWQKTIVGRDGALLYDYPGSFAGFGLRLAFALDEPTSWQRQELRAPRVPMVRTVKQAGDLEIVEEAFAVAVLPSDRRVPASLSRRIERVDGTAASRDWAQPPAGADPAFRHIAVGYNQPVQYRFAARRDHAYTVVFGLCEGWHTNAGQRILELRLEGQCRRTIDPLRDLGRNVPGLFPFEVTDRDGDGWIDAAVTAAAEARDKNTILNVLWVFPAHVAPPAEALLAGQSPVPPVARVDCGADDPSPHPPRCDTLLVRLRNHSVRPAVAHPRLNLETAQPVVPAHDRQIEVGSATRLIFAQPCTALERTNQRTVLAFGRLTLPPRGEVSLSFTVARRGTHFLPFPRTVTEAAEARRLAHTYWQHLDLPYDRIRVPDPGIQAQLDAAVRNIYQAREIKKGLPAFQVGPTCYRGLWVVDGSFLLEAMTYLGRTNDTRRGVQYLLSFQRDDGGFLLIDGHWKETGIALWAIARHAQLTGDRAWLRAVWPQVRRGVAQIAALRRRPPADAPNAGLVPDGFSDGGLADAVPEYTNVYWTLAGLRAAVEAARDLGETDDAQVWQREFNDLEAAFRRAAQRDSRTDSAGNRYVPIRMARGEGIPPQKAQWAFLHAVFPGRVFAPEDPLVAGNLAMLRAAECQDLVRDTGWLKNGIWTYFASFYAHAWLWTGQPAKAARTLYAFANHASPLLCWREEQMPVGEGTQVVGDMPHNWASAEFIRLTRHTLALERGEELHLLEALPLEWVRPGARTRLDHVLTAFGPLDLDLRVAGDGASATLRVTPPTRRPPRRILVHVEDWSRAAGVRDIPVRQPSRLVVPLK
jgi:hypothetical protein